MARPEHQPTAFTRKMVGALAFEGATQERISRYMEIDPKTLRKFYRKELDHETLKLCALVASNLVHIALRPNGGAASVSAGKYILSCKAGWKETSKLEIEQQGRGIGAVLKLVADAEADAAAEEQNAIDDDSSIRPYDLNPAPARH